MNHAATFHVSSASQHGQELCANLLSHRIQGAITGDFSMAPSGKYCLVCFSFTAQDTSIKKLSVHVSHLRQTDESHYFLPTSCDVNPPQIEITAPPLYWLANIG